MDRYIDLTSIYRPNMTDLSPGNLELSNNNKP
jgi:hypothetical protein